MIQVKTKLSHNFDEIKSNRAPRTDAQPSESPQSSIAVMDTITVSSPAVKNEMPLNYNPFLPLGSDLNS